MRIDLWIPKPVYERIPQFYFLVGLLFVANGLYLGFEIALAFYYIGFGLISCGYGVGIFLIRMQHRQTQAATQFSPPAGQTPMPTEEPTTDALTEHSEQA